LADEVSFDHSLKDRITEKIRTAASPRHVPAVILEVPEIPKTLSGKPVELAVRAIIQGEKVVNLNSISNPDVLAYFQNRSELMVSAGSPDSG
jgi:acetoacetyl-CoA synthetase